MKSLFVTCLLLLTVPAMAADVTITTGGRGGSYFSTGEQLSKILEEYDYKTEAIRSKGSVENIERVAAGEATMGFTQLDALAWWMNRNPGKNSNIKILGNLFTECVYIAVNEDGDVNDLGDLQGRNAKIAVQKRGSGSAVTWEYMRELEKSFSRAQTIYQGGMQVLSQLATQPDGEVNAFMWVSNPENLDQRYLKTVLNSDKLQLIDVDDWDLNDKHEKLNRSIYRFEEPDVAKGLIFNKDFSTICMDAVVISHDKADDDLLDDVADILINNRSRLFPPKED